MDSFLALSVPRVDLADRVNRFVEGFLLDDLLFVFTFVRSVLRWVYGWIEWFVLDPSPLVIGVYVAALVWRWTNRWIALGTLAVFAILEVTGTWHADATPLAMGAIAVALAWTLRGRAFALFTFLAFGLVQSMGFWTEAMQTLALVLVASAIAVAIGIPIGILAARRTAVSNAIKPVLDFMQTMPSFIYLLLAVMLFRIGAVPGAIASLLFAMPPAVRLTELGIRQVDREVVEAAHAFGARPRQILRQVQLPLAMPTIMAGVNQVIMLALSMVVIAGLGGAPGLGQDVVRAVTRLDIGLGFESGISVVILAIFLDRATAALRPTHT